MALADHVGVDQAQPSKANSKIAELSLAEVMKAHGLEG